MGGSTGEGWKGAVLGGRAMFTPHQSALPFRHWGIGHAYEYLGKWEF